MMTRLIQQRASGAPTSLGTTLLTIAVALLILITVPDRRACAQVTGETSAETTSTTATGLVPPPNAPAVIALLESAFARGDAAALIRHSARRLDITLFGSSELFSRSQAGYVLKAFFDEYEPERLVLNETSGSEGNWFAAGRYWYAAGDLPLAVFLRVRRADDAWELREVRIGRSIDR